MPTGVLSNAVSLRTRQRRLPFSDPMNLAERWFALLTALHLRRGVHPNVLALKAVLRSTSP